MGKSKYSDEFKREALRICELQGVRTTSEKLGVPVKTLYLWQRLERIDNGQHLKGLKPGETAEEGFKRLERENAELREANHILKKAMGFFVGELYAWIAQNHDTSSIALCCAALGVRREGYYAWQKRPSRVDRDLALVSALKKVREKHPAYGVRSMIDALPETMQISYGKGYSICRDYGLLQKRRKPHGITKANPAAQASEDLLQRDFNSDTPNTKWLTDITEMKCKDGKLYLCAVLDCFDASIVGFSMDGNMKTPLCMSALNNAVKRYGKTNGLIIHSDRGSQFTSRLFRELLLTKGLKQSMGRTGSCFDNARMESFFATLKKDLIYRFTLPRHLTLTFYYSNPVQSNFQ